MNREYRFGQFLAKNKSNMSIDNFTNDFYRNIAYFNLSCEKDAYKDLLKELYEKGTVNYDDWRKAFNRINYSFVRSHKDLVVMLVKENRIDLLDKAFEMEKRKSSLISRCIPIKTTTGSIKYSKEYLYELLCKTLALLDSESMDNPIKKSQDSFYLSYGQYENDEYLGNLYDDIMNSFDKNIKSAIQDEINKIDGLCKHLVENMCLTVMKDDLDHSERCHRTPNIFKQKRKSL